MFVIDEKQRLLSVNSAFRKNFGLDDQEKPKSLWDFVSEDRSRIILESAVHSSDKGEASSESVLLRRNDGSVFWAEIHLSQQLSVEGLSFTMGSIYDVTRRELIDEKSAEKERNLTTYTDKLQKLNDAKTSFLGMAAHDLRTPLHKMSFIADMLLNTKVAADRRVELYNIILRSADSMKKLIDDLLSIAKFDSGDLELNLQAIDTLKFLEELANEFAIAAEEKNSTLVLVKPSKLPSVSIDPDRIRQALGNLIGNAIKFSPTGSKIELSAKVVDEILIFEVADQGPGVPVKEVPLLFEPFQKLTPKPTANESSSGLGLAISRRMVELHEGTIGMIPREGGGSIFWIKLPI